MSYLLNAVYVIVFALFLPRILHELLAKGKRRGGWTQKLLGMVPVRDGHGPCVWFHAVSVGEVLLLRDLIGRFAQRHPDWTICLSTTTKTGMEMARRHFGSYTLFYFPFDFTWAVNRALARVRPSMVVLAEQELWPNFIRAAARCGARVLVVNGRMSPRSADRYRLARPLLRNALSHIDAVAAQTDQYA